MNGALANVQSTGERAVTVLRLSGATTYSFTVVAVDPSGNVSAPSAAGNRDHAPEQRHDRADRPGNLYAFDFGCETWLFWEESVDDVDPQEAILYEVRVNGVFDGAQLGIDRWITYGADAVEHVLRAGGRQRGQPLADEHHHARQPGLLSAAIRFYARGTTRPDS